ncbi:MAG: hypothetical protein Kow0022_15990 [Phycisphaerales bacterium]
MKKWAVISASAVRQHRPAQEGELLGPSNGNSVSGALVRRGLTLFEVVMALALLVALTGVVLPLLFGRTGELSFRETLLQVERAASVARAESQRLSQAVLFECRWSERERAYQLGTVTLSNASGDASPVDVRIAVSGLDGPGSDADAVRSEQLPELDVLLTLPPGCAIQRHIPEEYFEQAGTGAADALGLEEGFSPPGEAGTGTAGGLVEAALAAAERPRRIVLAVFLPDGTLMGDERLYLLGPDARVGVIKMSRWLGTVSVEQVRLDGPQEKAEQDSNDATETRSQAEDAAGRAATPGAEEDRP